MPHEDILSFYSLCTSSDRSFDCSEPVVVVSRNSITFYQKSVTAIFHLVGAVMELTKASMRQLPQLDNAVDLFTHQDKYSCEYGYDRQNRSQTVEEQGRDQCNHACNYQPDAEKRHSYIL
jgi:hypothetical protein